MPRVGICIWTDSGVHVRYQQRQKRSHWFVLINQFHTCIISYLKYLSAWILTSKNGAKRAVNLYLDTIILRSQDWLEHISHTALNKSIWNLLSVSDFSGVNLRITSTAEEHRLWVRVQGLGAGVRRPPGVRAVRHHVPLCCANNRIIAAQHQIDVQLIHLSCELTGGAQRLHPASSYFKHTHNVSWQVRRRVRAAQLLPAPVLIMTFWPDRGLWRTTIIRQEPHRNQSFHS